MQEESPELPESIPFEQALSPERFGRYLAWAGGDVPAARLLYTRNVELAEALYPPLHMLEIALRNRIHAVMSETIGPDWFAAYALQAVGHQRDQLADAFAQRCNDPRSPPPGSMVAALSFSFWTAMLGPANDRLWQQSLHRIARRADGKGLARKDLARPLAAIRTLRNRIAHHEPILHWDLPRHHDAMLGLIRALCPAAAAWCRAMSRFPPMSRARARALAEGPSRIGP